MDENNEIINIKPEQPVLMKDILMLVGTLLLGILFVVLFFKEAFTISIPIFIAAFYLVMLLYNRKKLLSGSLFGWFLILPIIMLSLTYFFFANEFFRVLDLLLLPVLIVLQTMLVTGTNSFNWYSPAILLDLFFAFFFRCMVHIGKPFRLIGRLIVQKSGNSRLNPATARVLKGLLISLPFALFLIILLSSADMVFGSLMNTIPDLLRSLNLSEAIVRIIVAMVIFMLAFSYLWSLGTNEKPVSGLTESVKVTLPKVWEPVTILTVTVVIDIIYMLFVFVQFAYLFGGVNIGTNADFSYSEYARRGFFELVAVTVINIGILAFFLSFTRQNTGKVGLVLRVMYSVMIGCTFVMLYSAHYRMSLYEENYGYTYLRMFTHMFMVFLLVLFIITLYKVWVDKAYLLKPYLVTAIVAFVIINYLNVDVLIARNNIDRFERIGKIDVNYLIVLSNDALPDIAAFTAENPVIAAELKPFLDNRKIVLSEDKGWQSFNLADYKALKALK